MLADHFLKITCSCAGISLEAIIVFEKGGSNEIVICPSLLT